jgi:hypothetical protein
LRLPPPWGKGLIEVQTGIRAISGQLTDMDIGN